MCALSHGGCDSHRGRTSDFNAGNPSLEAYSCDGVTQLQRQYKFKSFKSALEFTNKLGAIAELEDHHPAILTEWGSVTVTWWTHTINGLHHNDFIMAAKTDHLIA